MARRPDRRLDHRGAQLPAGVYLQRGGDGAPSGYEVRWREEGPDGGRHASKTFSGVRCGSLDRALEAACEYRERAVRVTAIEGSMLRADPDAAMSVNELFEEWCVGRGPLVSQRYLEKVCRYWEREIAPRAIGRARLSRLSQDPAIVVRFQDELLAAGVSAGNRVEILKSLRSVLRWGRRRHPNALTVEFSGLFEMPRVRTGRLAFATDAYGLERLIEAVLGREVHDDLYALRDAAFVAAMGFTIAARPSEWLNSARWGDVCENSVELQRPRQSEDPLGIGLKTGARAALLLSGATLRLSMYRAALEERFGAQPPQALVFQALGAEGPIWTEDGEPLAWDYRDYQGWVQRVWRFARARVAAADDVADGLAQMRFYDCRHTAISMALHSTLVSGPHGMNLHSLAAWAGHDVGTLQRYYAHVIARYHGGEPIDLEQVCAEARARVAEDPAG